MTNDSVPALEDRLFEERVVRCFGRLDDQAVTELAARLWTLDALGDEAISLLVSISGGTVGATAALLDVLDVIGVEVQVTCVGGISGPPVALLAGASKRTAAPSARLVLRDERVELSGSFADLERAVASHHDQRRRLLARLADSTSGRRSVGDVLTDFERGVGLDAAEALAYGLIDQIAQPRARLTRLPRTLPGFGFGRP